MTKKEQLIRDIKETRLRFEEIIEENKKKKKEQEEQQEQEKSKTK